ncbi:MAG: glycosyltransferase [Thermodesulfobacteriota bacterium]
MRLIFLYAQSSSRALAEHFPEEGYHYLLRLMVAEGLVDSALAIIDGLDIDLDYGRGFRLIGVRGLSRALDLLQPGDIIWCRGGWRAWYSDFLVPAHERGHWLGLYAANSGRARWPIWHVILDDLSGREYWDNDRLHLDFRKPINPDIFQPLRLTPSYDVMIGASHIHDKKGQWRGIEAAIAYQRLFGRRLRCILPGAFHHGERTSRIKSMIREHDLVVVLPGMVSRPQLCRLYNESRLFLALGSHGQGDRGPIEALACGTPVIIGFPQYHAPWTRQLSCCIENPDQPETIAAHIQTVLQYRSDLDQETKQSLCWSFQASPKYTVAQYRPLFNFLRNHAIADIKALRMHWKQS